MRENVGDRENQENFDQTVSRRHFISRADVNNVRVKVQDNLVQRHKDDATSVSLFVSELQFGGEGKKKQSCFKRKCINIVCDPERTVVQNTDITGKQQHTI